MEKRQQIVSFDNQEKQAKFINKDGIVDQKTLALYFLMSVTGIEEISNLDHVKNFIYRIQFVFKIMNIEPGKIEIGQLFFNFDKNGNTISFTLADLREHLGIHIDMVDLESVSEEEFFKTIPYRYKYAFINDMYEEQAISIFDSNYYNVLFLNTNEIKCHITSKMKAEALQKTNLTLSKLEYYDKF